MSRLSVAGGTPPERCLTRGERDGAILSRTRVLAHAPSALAGLAALNDALEQPVALDPLLRQIAVLAVVRRSPYEMGRQVRVALSLGMDENAVEAFEEEDWTHPAFTAAQRIAFRYAMLFDGGYGVQNEIFDELRQHLSEAAIAELSIVCAHSGGLARLAIALGFPPEERT